MITRSSSTRAAHQARQPAPRARAPRQTARRGHGLSAAATIAGAVALALWFAVATAAAAGPARSRATAAAPARELFTGRLLVSLRAAPHGLAHASAVRAIIARTGARPDGPSIPQIGLVTVRPPAGVTPRRLLTVLRSSPGVRAVSLERRFSLRDVPNDPALAAPETAPGTPPGTPVEWWPAKENLRTRGGSHARRRLSGGDHRRGRGREPPRIRGQGRRDHQPRQQPRRRPGDRRPGRPRDPRRRAGLRGRQQWDGTGGCGL